MDNPRALISTCNLQALALIRRKRESFSFVIQLARTDDDLMDALEYARAGSRIKEFSAIVIDLNFENSIACFRDFRALNPLLPIMAVAGEGSEDLRLEAARAGASAIIFARDWPDLLLGSEQGRDCLLARLIALYSVNEE